MLLAGDAADALAELHRLLEPIRLAGLAGSDVESLVQHLVGAEHASRIARSIHRRSGGNPLFVGELVRLVAIEPGRGTSLPATIRAVIERRLAAVAPRSVEVLRAAAVDGVQVVQEAAGVSC